MTQSETSILRYFRQYRIGAHEMLFFNTGMVKSHPPEFRRAMASLIDNGLVVEERQRNAYSLTQHGYSVSLSVD
jgi:hypothetical protein